MWGVFGVQNTWEAGVQGEEEQGKRLASLAREAGVQHYVYTSVGSAHRKTGIPHFDNKYRVEDTIRAAGFPSYVIFRPVFFMENLTSPWFLNGDAIYAAMRPDLKLQMISVGDIGKYVARGFTNADKLNRREIDLAADEVTMPDVAMALSRGLGRNISFVADSDLGGPQEQRRLRRDARVVRSRRLRRRHPVARTRVRHQGDEACGLGGEAETESSRKSKVESPKSKVDESRGCATGRHHRSGLQQNFVAWDESSRVAAARDAGAGGVEAGGRTSQHLGNRRARGLLEVRGGASIHGRHARIVSTERVELVSAAGGAARIDRQRPGRPISVCSTTCTMNCAPRSHGSRRRSCPARRQERKSATSRSLSGVAAHDLYHAGQIQLLKRLCNRVTGLNLS